MPALTTSASGVESLSGRERILTVAAQRFLDAGYVETSLRDLAADVGMKAGSMYYHFESKDALLIAVLDRGMTFMVEAFEEVEVSGGPVFRPSGESTPPRQRLAAHISAHLRALHDNRAFTAGHVTLFRTAPKVVREAVVPLRNDYESRWAMLLAVLLPERSSEDLTMLRLSLFGAMNASIDWLDTDRGSVDRFARLVTDQFWCGVAPEAHASASGSETDGRGR